MEIPRALIQHYIEHMTVGIFDHLDLPPDDLAEYDRYIRDMKLEAARKGDLDTLKAGLEYLLTNREIDTEPIADARYSFDDSEVRELLRYAYSKIWPESRLPEQIPDVQLTDDATPEWRKRRDS